jgi:hypothetical protein
VDSKGAEGHAETHTLLEKIYEILQLRGEAGVSNAAVRAAVSIKKLERRATTLADAKEASTSALHSWEHAITDCTSEVTKIVRDCRRMNGMFFDEHFDIDYDIRSGKKDCLISLDGAGSDLNPGCVLKVKVCLSGEYFVTTQLTRA